MNYTAMLSFEDADGLVLRGLCDSEYDRPLRLETRCSEFESFSSRGCKGRLDMVMMIRTASHEKIPAIEFQ